MNSFEANKIVGALLGTVFVLFGGSLLAEGLFHSEAPEKPGYEIVAAEPDAGGGAAAAPAEDPPVAALLQNANVESRPGHVQEMPSLSRRRKRRSTTRSARICGGSSTVPSRRSRTFPIRAA